MSEPNALTLEQLEEHLDAHGSVLERWPEELRPAARRLLDSSPEARAAWARAERLAALLDAAPDVLPSAALQARIAALPARHPQGWASWWPFGNPLAPLLGWAAAAAIGVFVGSSPLSSSLPGLELDAPGNTAALAAEPLDDDAADSLSSESLSSDSLSSDSLSSEEWGELELALGLDPEWEEEP